MEENSKRIMHVFKLYDEVPNQIDDSIKDEEMQNLCEQLIIVIGMALEDILGNILSENGISVEPPMSVMHQATKCGKNIFPDIILKYILSMRSFRNKGSHYGNCLFYSSVEIKEAFENFMVWSFSEYDLEKDYDEEVLQKVSELSAKIIGEQNYSKKTLMNKVVETLNKDITYFGSVMD